MYCTSTQFGGNLKGSADRVNSDLIRAYVQNSGATFDNAIDIVKAAGHDAILDPSVLVCQKQKGVEHYPIECSGWKTWATMAQFMGEISHEVIPSIAARSNLPIFSKDLIAKSVELGADWHYGTSAVVLVKDADGAVMRMPAGLCALVTDKKWMDTVCAAGKDTDFGKDSKCMIPVNKAPFYGVKGNNAPNGSVGLVTLAGVNTDKHMNVLDISGNPIKGLYVAGNTLGNRYGVGYATPCAGNSIGMAQTHGYVLGQYLAALEA